MDWSSPLDIWRNLVLFSRLFIILFVAIAVYTFAFGCVALSRICRKRALADPAARHNALRLVHRMTNLRRATTALFYSFGVAFFLQLMSSFKILDESRRPLSSIIFQNLGYAFQFGELAFLGFFALYMTQWILSARIERVSLRLQTHID